MKKFFAVGLLSVLSAPAFALECGGWQQVKLHSVTVVAYHDGHGDNEMGGRNPIIEGTQHLILRDGAIVAKGMLTMRENHDDWSTFSGSNESVVFQSAECHVAEMYKETNLSGRLYVRDAGSNNHDWTVYPGEGAISEANCLSDTNGGIGGGSDSGAIGCTFSFHDIWVRLAPMRESLPLTPAPGPSRGQAYEKVKKVLKF